MASIKISDFKGCVPKRSPKLLPENFAQTAENCDLIRGKITAIKDVATQTQTANLITSPTKIHKFSDVWLSWSGDVDVIKGDVINGTERVYFTLPQAVSTWQTSYRMATMRGAWFTLNAYKAGADMQHEYYVLVTVDGAGNDPAPTGKTKIEVDIDIGDTAAEVATKIASGINAIAHFGAVSGGTTTVTVTNAAAGFCVPPISKDCGFAIATTTLGVAGAAQVATIVIPASPDPTSGAGYPITSVRLGVGAPTMALTPALVGTGAGNVIRSTNYVYTHVTPWGEESAPSLATETIDIQGVPQVTAVTCAALTKSGQYFIIDTVTDKLYVWYHIVKKSVLTVDFSPSTIITGDYFTFYKIMQPVIRRTDDNGDIWYQPAIELAWTVWYQVLEDDWDDTVTYGATDVCSYLGSNYESLKGGNENHEPTAAEFSEWWKRDPDTPSAIDSYRSVKVLYNASDTDAAIAERTREKLSFYFGFAVKVSGTTLTFTQTYEGDVSDPSDSGTSCTLALTNGTDYSADPGVSGRTGIRIDIDASKASDEATIAIETAETLNDSDHFTCESPQSNIQTVGPLVIGTRYEITLYKTGDDFTGVGGTNVTGNVFVATGTAPTWTKLSELVPTKLSIVNRDGGEVETAPGAGDSGFTVAATTTGGVQTVTLTGEINAPAWTMVSHCRLYRAVTASNGVAEYQLVPPYQPYDDDVAYVLGNKVHYNGSSYYCHTSPAGAGFLPTNTTYWKELDSSDLPYSEAKISGFSDSNISDGTLEEVIATEDWDVPPFNLSGLIRFDNGIIAGFVDNEVYFFEPFYPYACPWKYMQSFPDDIVALSYTNGSIVVLTEGNPFIITGSDPGAFTQIKLPDDQPCLAKRGVLTTDAGVIYPCPDGLFSISMNGGTLISKSLFTKTQWEAYAIANMVSAYHDDRCFCLFSGDEDGFFIDFKSDLFVTNVDLNSANQVYDVFVDGDDLYFLLKAVAGVTYEIWKWRGHAANYKAFTWKSKKVQLPYLASFSCGRVIADGAIEMKVYIDGSLHQTIAAIANSNVFRLSSGALGRVFEIELTGSSDVDFAGIATSPMELSL